MKKIFISVYPFAKYDRLPLNLLEKKGFQISINPYSRKLTPEELLKYAQNAQGLIAGTEKLNLLINSNSNLKIISRVGIGLDSVPLKLCKKKNIAVSYTPDAVTNAVVDLTIGLIINVLRHISFLDRKIRLHEWDRLYGKSLKECIFGIIGVGRIGKKVTEMLSYFNPKAILLNDIKNKTPFINSLNYKNISLVSKEEIYQKSDIISLHVPLTSLTRHMINSDSLSLFSKSAYLINTARGDLVCEKALFKALKQKNIQGAALDVYSNEPYKGNLTKLENIILTHHIGSCSYDSRLNMELEASKDIINFFDNKPLINPIPNFEYRNSQD